MKYLTALLVLTSFGLLASGCNKTSDPNVGKDTGRTISAPQNPNQSIEDIKKNPNMSPKAKEMAIWAAQQQMAAAQSRQQSQTIAPPGPPPKSKDDKK